MPLCQSTKVLRGMKFQVTHGGKSFLLKIPGNQSGFQGVRSEFLISEFLWHQIMRPLQVSGMSSANSLREKRALRNVLFSTTLQIVFHKKGGLWNICTRSRLRVVQGTKIKSLKTALCKRAWPSKFLFTHLLNFQQCQLHTEFACALNFTIKLAIQSNHYPNISQLNSIHQTNILPNVILLLYPNYTHIDTQTNHQMKTLRILNFKPE